MGGFGDDWLYIFHSNEEDQYRVKSSNTLLRIDVSERRKNNEEIYFLLEKGEFFDDITRYLAEKNLKYTAEVIGDNRYKFNVSIFDYEQFDTSQFFNELDFETERLTTLFESGDFKVANTNWPGSNIYFDFQGKNIVRIELKDKKIHKIHPGIDYTDELSSLMFAINPEFPLRDILKYRFFNSDIPEELVTSYKKAYLEHQEFEQKINNLYSPENLPEWQTTDPRNHDPEFFRYIVHGVDPEDQENRAHSILLSIYKDQEDDDFEDINIIDDTDEYLNRGQISTSLIDQKHREVWKPGGIICDVDTADIIEVSNTTLAASGVHIEQNKNIPAAAELPRDSYKGQVNEVLVKHLDITGCFIVIDPITKKPVNEDLVYTIKAFAERLNVPLVKILKA